jgi:perosamine synthetase
MKLERLVVSREATIKTTLEKINDNCKGLCFVADDQNRLIGVVTDGDIRRGLLNGKGIETKVNEVLNTHYVSLHYKASDTEIVNHLNDKIKLIPLVDDNNYIVDYASINKIRRIPIANPILDGNELNYVTECIKTNWISSQGKFVKRFEAQFSELLVGQQALAVSNGTVALHLALVAYGIGPGDEVILPDLTFAATINAVLYTGATPVIVDIDPHTWCIDPSAVQAAIGKNTKAILPVHLYGHPADVKPLVKLAEQHNLIIIEDCAEALGSEYYGKPVGFFSHASTFSFFGNKTITTGEGGMIVFREKAIADRARILRDHGMSSTRKYWHDSVGFNYRMTNVQAAIGVAQMERLDEILKKKLDIANYYNRYFAEIPEILTHKEKHWAKHTYWMYCIHWAPDNPLNREDLVDFLFRAGIETRPVFYPLSSMPVYAKYRLSSIEHTHSHAISSTGLCLPSSIDIDEEVVHRIVDQINAFMKQVV